jgi:THO complex subunit 2
LPKACPETCPSTSYKQHKFNLLREQSEGYSKLLVEITSNLPASNDPATGLPTLTGLELSDLASAAWEKIVSIIGYFDLDPNRALDIIVDVFSVHVVNQYAFFLELLRKSPWAPLPPPPSSETLNGEMPIDGESPYKGKSFDEVLRLAEPKDMPHPPERNGTCIVAQILGFKFSHYQVRICVFRPAPCIHQATVARRGGRNTERPVHDSCNTDTGGFLLH